MAISYVKFIRGTQAKYNALLTKDKDTLYFTYENESDQKGKLYLGNKLISGGLSESGELSVSDLKDFLLDEHLSDGSLLVYDEAEGKWVNKTIAEALDVATMVGASTTDNGTAGLVPAPKAGDEEKFLRGDGTWAVIQTSDVSGLTPTVTKLVGEDTDKSVREIAEEVLIEKLIPNTAKDTLDSLDEIANWIQNHQDATDVADTLTRVEALELTVNGKEEAEGQAAVKGLVAQVSDVNNLLGDLSNLKANGDKDGSPVVFNTIQQNLEYLNTTTDSINERLQWHEL